MANEGGCCEKVTKNKKNCGESEECVRIHILYMVKIREKVKGINRRENRFHESSEPYLAP